MDAVFVDKDTLHFEICLLAVLLVFILDECILKAVTGPLVTNDFARDDSAEAAKDQI